VIRHREVTRIEGFSDAVFGFALTLLVVSLETPKDFTQLKGQLAGFVPFALMFAMVCWIWYEHNKFFRRYGLQDALTTFLNSVLLFVVLFYVYPLRFLTIALVGPMVGLAAPGFDDGEIDGALLMTFYSGGVLVIFTVFVLLHLRARAQRASLNLGPVEELQLRFSLRSHIISVSIAVLSLLLLAVGIDSMWAGLIYAAMGPVHAWNGFQAGKAHEQLAHAAVAPASVGTA
jgi:uncharacterized membrane protein